MTRSCRSCDSKMAVGVRRTRTLGWFLLRISWAAFAQQLINLPLKAEVSGADKEPDAHKIHDGNDAEDCPEWNVATFLACQQEGDHPEHQRERQERNKRENLSDPPGTCLHPAQPFSIVAAYRQTDFNAVKGSTRAARRAAKYDAQITAGTNRTATNNSVLQSHGLTSYRNPRS